MSLCVGCGAEPPDAARYCSRCGLPTGSQSVPVDLLLSTDGEDVSRRARAPAPSESIVARRLSAGPIALAAIIIGALAWTVTTTAADKAPGTAGEQLSGPTTIPPFNPERRDGPIAGSRLDEPTTPTTAGQAGSRPDVADFFGNVEFTSNVFTNLSVKGPLLDDGLVGYRLVAAGGDQLFDIDLDTGSLTRHRMQADIVGMLADELIVFTAGRGFVALPADDLSSTGRTVFTVPEVSDGDGTVSVDNLLRATVRPPDTLLAEFRRPATIRQSPRRLGTQLYEVNVESGRFTATTIAVDSQPGSPDRTRHGLVALDGGGLFEATANRYQRLADGHGLLLGVNHAIVRQCDEPSTCRGFWVDRASGQEIERALPDLTGGGVTAIDELDSEANVVLVTGADGPWFFDVENDRPLNTLEPLSLTFDQGPLGQTFGALSPDGRWMALYAGGSIVLYDRRFDQLYRHGSGPSVELEQFVFVPNGR